MNAKRGCKCKGVEIRNTAKFSAKQGGGGAFQGVASIAVLNAALAARSKVLREKEDMDPRNLVMYCSDQVNNI